MVFFCPIPHMEFMKECKKFLQHNSSSKQKILPFLVPPFVVMQFSPTLVMVAIFQKEKRKKYWQWKCHGSLPPEAEMPRPSLWNVCPKLFCKLPLANGLYCLAGPKSKILEYHLPPSTQPGEAALRKIRALLKRKGSKCESLQWMWEGFWFV